ncbi:hypothetical protein R5R35_008491 [Gryllus longicercus]|uniref:Uncharacterized protein n=1 Tax=Gryllus longicercus TaxID=2509291 RepID=A0AAN9YZH9_9ORTH
MHISISLESKQVYRVCVLRRESSVQARATHGERMKLQVTPKKQT